MGSLTAEWTCRAGEGTPEGQREAKRLVKKDAREKLEILKPLSLNLQARLEGFINSTRAVLSMWAPVRGQRWKGKCTSHKDRPQMQERAGQAAATVVMAHPQGPCLVSPLCLGSEYAYPVSSLSLQLLLIVGLTVVLHVCLPCSLIWKIAILRVLLLKLNKNLLPFNFYTLAPALPLGFA